MDTITVPVFPLPSGWYFGPRVGPRHSVSGHFNYRRALKLWQKQMQRRGWVINPTGLYDARTRAVTIAFQQEKDLKVDGRIGQATWSAAWTAPIT